jgi:hypothetical protein
MAAIAQQTELASLCCYLSPSMSFEHVSSYARFDRNLTATGCPCRSFCLRLRLSNPYGTAGLSLGVSPSLPISLRGKDYESEGHRFESCRAHYIVPANAAFLPPGISLNVALYHSFDHLTFPPGLAGRSVRAKSWKGGVGRVKPSKRLSIRHKIETLIGSNLSFGHRKTLRFIPDSSLHASVKREANSGCRRAAAQEE